MPRPPGMSEKPRRATCSAGMSVMSTPSKTIWPAFEGSTPPREFRNVDLPAPLVPRSATISPPPTVTSTPKSTWKLP